MTSYHWVHGIHLVAASVWLGGLITLGALIGVLRSAGVERPLLQKVARAFARLSWTAMAVAVATGLAQVHMLRLPWSYGALQTKIALVAATIAIALFHQLTAKGTTPRTRGLIQMAIIIASLAVVMAATRI